MPTPKPHMGESQDDFMDRCMGDAAMMEEFPENDQRMAVCMMNWRDKGRSAMETKQISSVKQLNEKGEGVAVIATLNVIDLDRDVTLPGAFGEQVVPMVPAHDWMEAPIGKAALREVENEVIAEFQLNLKTDGGRNWYEALKFDLDRPPMKQQYSYGFSIIESESGTFENQRVRFLKSLQVHEISPVLLGAGVGTGTLALKGTRGADLGVKMAEQLARSIEYLDSTISRLEEIRDIRAKSGRRLSKERLDDIARLKAAVERLTNLLGEVTSMKTVEEVTATHFEQMRRRVMGKSLIAAERG